VQFRHDKLSAGIRTAVSPRNEPRNIAIIPLVLREHDDYPFMAALALHSKDGERYD
jgi:hypothetical protein